MAVAEDHPRSRGVYNGRIDAESMGGGSSPLARGLPQVDSRGIGALGIIPARAGFTSARGRQGRPWADHPRSRGVYGQSTLSSVNCSGSSPLARGLLVGPHAGRGHHRIIPARAGFTRTRSTPTTRPEDHPRSRGVYTRRPGASSTSAGSSPLARGLPPSPARCGRRARIIPARAGFTSSSSSSL